MRLTPTLALLLALGACKKDRPPSAVVEAAIEAPAVPVRPPEERRDEAARLLAAGADVARARALLVEVTRERPKDAVAWYDLGVAAWQMGDLQPAAEAFARATSADGKLADAWRALGLVELELGQVGPALKRFDKGLALAPDDLELHVARIDALRRAGRAKDAIEAAKAALKLDARCLPAYNLMGLAWLDLGELELARFVYEKAETVEGAEADPVIQANFGWSLYEAGERYAAEQRLKRAVELDPDFVPGLVYLARLYLDDRNHADTIPLLETARAKAPGNHGVWVDLGIAYRGVGRLDEARAAWEHALTLDPREPTPLFNLGILLGDDLKRYDDAIARFQAYIDAGGPEAAAAKAHVGDLERERQRAEAQRRREEDRRRREAERAERERLLEAERARQREEAEQVPPTPEAPPSGAGEAPPDSAESPPSPWDTTGTGR